MAWWPPPPVGVEGGLQSGSWAKSIAPGRRPGLDTEIFSRRVPPIASTQPDPGAHQVESRTPEVGSPHRRVQLHARARFGPERHRSAREDGHLAPAPLVGVADDAGCPSAARPRVHRVHQPPASSASPPDALQAAERRSTQELLRAQVEDLAAMARPAMARNKAWSRPGRSAPRHRGQDGHVEAGEGECPVVGPAAVPGVAVDPSRPVGPRGTPRSNDSSWARRSSTDRPPPGK